MCCSAIDLEHVAEMKKQMKNSLEAYVYSNNIWKCAFRASVISDSRYLNFDTDIEPTTICIKLSKYCLIYCTSL